MRIFLETLYTLISLGIVVAIVYLNAYEGSGNPFVYLVALLLLGTLIISDRQFVLLWLFGRKEPVDENVAKLIIAMIRDDGELARDVSARTHRG